MEFVGAFLDGGGDDAAGVAVILRVQRTIDQVELVNGIQVRNERKRIQGDIVGVCAVDQKLGLLRLAAADGIGAEAVAGRLHAGLGQFQPREVAANQRQLHNLLGVDDVA